MRATASSARSKALVDIAVKGVWKAFEQDRYVLKDLSLEVYEGERVGMLGRNGAGKSTLFKIITGELEADRGEVVLGTGRRVGVMTQIPVYPPDYSTEDVLKTAHARLDRMQEKLTELQQRMARGEQIDEKAYDRLQSTFESAGGYETDVVRSKVCAGLDIPAELRSRPFRMLSGGEKTRVNLARLILEETDILLLDEPTNHLDLHATEWLEDYLLHFKGTVLTISHDRYFLDRAVQRIVELTDGHCEFYSGNYSFFVTEKQRRYDEAQKQYEKNQKQIAQLQKAADDLHLWAFMGNDKLHKRAFSMEKRIERLQSAEKPTVEKRLKARFGETTFRGDDALVIHGMDKAFGEKKLFRDVEMQVTGGERIALIGDNGAGKSTLLSILMGKQNPDRGVCHFGPAVKSAMLEQQVHFEDMSRTLVDTMLYEGGCTPQEARDRLGAFGFRGEDAFKYVSDLSGGELSRLRLCILMKDDVNFLILDEPTNHLDILSREWMEDALTDYGEALLFVSHDRYFIAKFATRIWELENGTITDWKCPFEEYRARKERQQQVLLAKQAEEKKQLKKEQPKKEKSGNAARNAQRKLNVLEREIAALEAKQKELEDAIQLNGADYQKLNELFEEQTALNGQIEAKYEEWTALSEELDANGN